MAKPATTFSGIGRLESKYDPETETYTRVNVEVWRFDIGDRVGHLNGRAREGVITNLWLREPESIGADCLIEVDGRYQVAADTLKPLDPARISFAPTVAANKGGKPAHDLAVFVTLEEAEREVSRLRSIGYPHELMILTTPVP